MSAIKNVIVIGATGNLGPTVLKALQESGQFNITVLTRDVSKTKSILPPNTRIVTADYHSVDSLAAAFKGQDAVVATSSASTIENQHELVVDAAINAGVKRFIASDFGSNMMDKKTADLVVFTRRVAARKYLEEKAAEGKITWSAIACGAFFGWGLNAGFLGFNTVEKKAIIYDGGNSRFSASTLPTIGAAVVSVLSHPQETENKYLLIQSAVITQLQILALFEKLTGTKWEVEHRDTAELERKVNQDLAKGDYSTIGGLIYRAALGEGYGGEFLEDNNDLLGLPKLDAQGVEDVIKSVL